MKRIFTMGVCMVLLLALLTACGAEEPVIQTVQWMDMTFEINRTDRTIARGDEVCRYRVEDDGNKTTYTILYDDGAEYYMIWEEYLGYGGWNQQYTDNHHSSGGDFVEVLKANQPKLQLEGIRLSDHFLWGLLVIVIGVITVCAPYGAWYLEHGLYYKDAEPSEIALNLIRMGGVLMIVGGVVMLFV